MISASAGSRLEIGIRGGFLNVLNAPEEGGTHPEKVAPRELGLLTLKVRIVSKISGERGQFQGRLKILNCPPPLISELTPFPVCKNHRKSEESYDIT